MSRSHVTKSVPPGAVVSGNPARPHREQLRQDALLARLGSLVGRVEQLEKAAGHPPVQPKRKAATAKRKAPKRKR
jgi:hypothetical protein